MRIAGRQSFATLRAKSEEKRKQDMADVAARIGAKSAKLPDIRAAQARNFREAVKKYRERQAKARRLGRRWPSPETVAPPMETPSEACAENAPERNEHGHRVYPGDPNDHEAIKKFIEAAEKSGDRYLCPMCDGLNATYNRYIRTPHLTVLQAIADLGGSATKKRIVEKMPSAPGDFSYLRHWGLLSISGGVWALTDAGRRFLAGEIAVPAMLTLKRNIVVEVSEAVVTASDLLRRPKFFEVAQLMRGTR